MGWTEERVDTLRKLWLDGHSASQIAKQLGGVTRNAVIGKVHRLGLSGRAAPSQPVRQVFKPTRPARPVQTSTPQARRAPEPVASASAPTSATAVAASAAPSQVITRFRADEPGSATVLTLGAHMCKWPIGDPGDESFGFCGRRTGEDGPYCREHASVAYQPAPKRTGKRNEGSELARSLRRYV